MRPLLEDGIDVFIRFNEGLSILRKVVASRLGKPSRFRCLTSKRSIDWLVPESRSACDDLRARTSQETSGDVLVYQNGGMGWIAAEVNHRQASLDRQVESLTLAEPLTGTGNRDTYPHRFSARHSSATRQSLPRPISVIGPFDSKSEAESVLVLPYLSTDAAF